MTNGRRRFLGKLPAVGVAVALSGLAGCTSTTDTASRSVTDTSEQDPATPAYANWLYDPTSFVDAENRVYSSFDVQRLYENRELLPAGLFSTLDAVDDALDAVSVAELGNVTSIAYSRFDPAQWQTNTESGLSFVARRTFDASAIDAELASLDGVSDAGTYDGYSLHTTEFEWDLDSLGEHTASITVATSEDALVAGVTLDLEDGADPLESVKRPIDSAIDERTNVTDEFDDAAVLLQELGETTFAIGFDVRRDLFDNVVDDDSEALDEAAADVVGLGLDLDFDGDDLRGDTIVVFEDEQSAAEADVATLVEADDQTTLEDAVVATDGRVSRITSTVDAEALWREYWPAVDLGGDSE